MPDVTPTILVTGAAGRVGTAFRNTEIAGYRLRLGDIDTASLQESGHESVALDITEPDSCRVACDGVHAVLHLAADASPDADFTSALLPKNVMGTYHMLVAARDAGCTRFVFASSAQAVEGYPLDVQVHENMPSRPKNLYGASKVFGEAMAAHFADTSTMTTVAVRIGNVAHFEAGQRHSARDTAAFISERDTVQLLQRCLSAPLSGFTLVHGVSNNRYKRLSIDATRRSVGYEPVDDAFAILEGGSPR